MNNKKKLSLGILVLILVGVGYAIMRPKPVIKTVTNPPMIVTMATATPKNVTETVTINGTIAPRDDIIISTELTGLRVLSVSADEGDTVKKGQILAVLDNNMLINDGRQLKADLDKAAADYQRAQSMIKNGAISREKFDERQANFQSLKARYDNNLLQQKRTNLTAPVNGIIYRRQINAGDLIQGNQILFNIAARGESELAGAVPEAILSRIAIEGAADILLTGREQPIKGTIRMIAPRINNTSRTAEIRLRLPKDVFIPIGSFGQAILALGEKQGLALPPTAIMTDSDGPFVWVAPDNVVKRQAVRIILRQPDLVLVDGLDNGQQVIARAGSFLQSGDTITVMDGNAKQ